MTLVDNPYHLDEKQRQFAQDLAMILGDIDHLLEYERFALHYPEPWLRLVLAEVQAYPEQKIKKSRGALFRFLIRKYGDAVKNDARN